LTVESVTYLDDLNASNPASGDAKSEGDDHIRNIKTALLNTFPNVDGAISATDSDLSRVAGADTAVLTFSSGNMGLGVSPTNLVDFLKTQAANTIVQAKNASTSGSASTVFRLMNSANYGDLFYTSTGNTGGSGVNSLNLWNQYTGGTLSMGVAGTWNLVFDPEGNAIYKLNGTAPTLDTNATMVFNLTSNTNLRISVRGSDGSTRVANVTLA
jgi:hypothetical protein